VRVGARGVLLGPRRVGVGPASARRRRANQLRRSCAGAGSTRPTQQVHAAGVRAADGAPLTARRGLATSAALGGRGASWRARLRTGGDLAEGGSIGDVAPHDRAAGGRWPCRTCARLQAGVRRAGAWPGGGDISTKFHTGERGRPLCRWGSGVAPGVRGHAVSRPGGVLACGLQGARGLGAALVPASAPRSVTPGGNCGAVRAAASDEGPAIADRGGRMRGRVLPG